MFQQVAHLLRSCRFVYFVIRLQVLIGDSLRGKPQDAGLIPRTGLLE